MSLCKAAAETATSRQIVGLLDWGQTNKNSFHRKVNAQKFETAFYAKPDLRNVRPPEEPVKSEPATLDLESLVEQLQKSPELASALAALIAAQAPAKWSEKSN